MMTDSIAGLQPEVSELKQTRRSRQSPKITSCLACGSLFRAYNARLFFSIFIPLDGISSFILLNNGWLHLRNSRGNKNSSTHSTAIFNPFICASSSSQKTTSKTLKSMTMIPCNQTMIFRKKGKKRSSREEPTMRWDNDEWEENVKKQKKL